MDDNKSPILYLHAKTRRILRRGEWVEVGLLKRAKIHTLQPQEGENAHHRAMMVRQQAIWAERGSVPSFVVIADDWSEIEGRTIHENWTDGGVVLVHEQAVQDSPIIGFALKGNSGYFVTPEYIESETTERDGQKVWVTHVVEDGREKILYTPSSR